MERQVADGLVVAEPGCRSRFEFAVATERDDADLRALLRETPMGGPVTVTFRREPSYFGAAVVEGGPSQVLVVRDLQTNRLVGMGACSVRARYVQGHEEPVGYLSGLRILPGYRSFGLLSRGYRLLRDLPVVSRAKVHLTTIADGNQRAMAALIGGRAGLPFYHCLGRYYTFALSTRSKLRARREPSVEIRPATADDLGMLIAYLQETGKSLNGCPRYEPRDFFGPNATFKHLRPADILLAFRNGHLVGVMGIWDQLAFRQVVVEGYGRALRLARPAYNAWSRIRGGPSFPSIGKPSRHLYVAFPLISNGETATGELLLDHLIRRVDRRRHDSLMIGVYERDPLCSWLKRKAIFTYVTHVYAVSWESEPSVLNQLRDQNLYLELGCL